MVLDWSERSSPEWQRRPLEVRIFEFWGGAREFNPMAILFPPHGPVETIRFWDAYRRFKHGDPRLLEATEAELHRRVAELAAGG